MKWIGLFCFLSLAGCSRDDLKTRICGQQNFLVKRLSHSALYKRGDSNLVFFTTYHNNQSNQYFLEIQNQRYVLRNDSLEYASATPVTTANVCAYVAALRQQLDSLNIKEYHGEPDGWGTQMVLYLKDGRVVFHTDEVARITYPGTLKNIRQAQPLCQNWYLGEY